MNPNLVNHFLGLILSEGLPAAKVYARSLLNTQERDTGRKLLNSIGMYHDRCWENSEGLTPKSVALMIHEHMISRARDRAVEELLEHGDLDGTIYSLTENA